MQNIKYNYYFTSIFEKKKKFPKSKIKALALRIVPQSSLHFPYSKKKKKKIYRITLYRNSNDNGSTRNGSRFSRKKNPSQPFEYSLLRGRLASERSNDVEREGILIWISNSAVTDHLPFHRRKFLPPLSSSSSSPPLFAPTDSRLDQTFENRPPSPLLLCVIPPRL